MQDGMFDIVKGAAAIVGAFIGFLLGEINGIFYMLITLIILDYLTGIMIAICQKELSSEIGFKGIAKKVCIIIAVIIANLVDVNILGGGNVSKTAVIFFYIANEGISVLENIGNLGVPLPTNLINIFKQIKEDKK